MKVNFFYTWTKNRDKENEDMKSISGRFWLPGLGIFSFLKKDSKG